MYTFYPAKLREIDRFRSREEIRDASTQGRWVHCTQTNVQGVPKAFQAHAFFVLFGTSWFNFVCACREYLCLLLRTVLSVSIILLSLIITNSQWSIPYYFHLLSGLSLHVSASTGSELLLNLPSSVQGGCMLIM